jgi:hypothetical protein
MLEIVTTFAVLGFAILVLAGMVRSDGHKIIAALKGQSWTAQHTASVRPVTVRFNSRYAERRPMRARPALRAAA